MEKRVRAIIIKDNKILTIKRTKPDTTDLFVEMDSKVPKKLGQREYFYFCEIKGGKLGTGDGPEFNNNSLYVGKYSMVAGHVDKGETFTQCIIREAEEEAEIILKPEDLKVAHAMCRNSGTEENNGRVDIFFVAEKWDGEIKNREPQKCDDLSWFDLNNLPDNIIPYIKQVIDCIKNKVFYSEQGW